MTKENRKYKSKYIPDKIKDSYAWQFSRRKYINSIFYTGLLTSLTSASLVSNIINETEILSQNQFSRVESVKKILFPSDNNGPGSYDVMG